MPQAPAKRGRSALPRERTLGSLIATKALATLWRLRAAPDCRKLDHEEAASGQCRVAGWHGMERYASDADFDRLSWHDNALYGLCFEVGDPDRDDWRSDLVLDIDHIVEWLCGPAGRARFRVAPATLTFHDVTDLRIAVDCGDSGGRVALHEPSIDAITRAPIRDPNIRLDRPYHRWRIALNLPRGGEIGFGASGFTQVLRAEPVLLDEQKLAAADRP